MKLKYKIKKEFEGSIVSIWVHGYPREIKLDKNTSQKDLAALKVLKHPAIEDDK